MPPPVEIDFSTADGQGRWRGVAGVGIALLGLGLFSWPICSSAAEAAPKVDRGEIQKLSSIVEWRGFWEAAETWTMTASSEGSFSRVNEDRHGSASFTLQRAANDVGWAPEAGRLEWHGQGESRPQVAKLSEEGNRSALVAHATLRSKSGQTKKLPEVDRFKFELIDTSREPEVYLNWPLGAGDDNYDLRIADFASGGSAADQAAALLKAVGGRKVNSVAELAKLSRAGLPTMSFPTVAEGGQKAELIGPPKDQAGRTFGPTTGLGRKATLGAGFPVA